ncbi:MAG: OB-fold nucleic acid binding domain-containing protein, partial [Erysipelotrichaceae bacterium]
MTRQLNDQQLARRDKMNKLKEMGINPFGNAFKRTHLTQDIRDKYQHLDKEQLEQENVTVKVAGRIMFKRRMGKLGFMQIQDRSGMIQIVVNRGIVGDDIYEIFKINDVGDFVGIEGTVMKTDSGEL